MTELVRSVRKILNEAGAAVALHRPQRASTGDPDDCKIAGVGGRTLGREGLIDRNCAGRGYFEFFH